jgi:hypothetical protein
MRLTIATTAGAQPRRDKTTHAIAGPFAAVLDPAALALVAPSPRPVVQSVIHEPPHERHDASSTLGPSAAIRGEV